MFAIFPSRISCWIFGDLGLDALRRLRRELAEADALLLEAVDSVLTALEVTVLGVLDREEDGGVDAFQRRGEDVRAEEALVGVDADPPDLLRLRGVEGAEAAAAGHLEDDVRAGGDLIERELLALRLDGEVLRVAVERLDTGERCLGARLVAGDVPVDRRLLLTADARDCGRAVGLRGEARRVAGEIADLLLLEEQPSTFGALPSSAFATSTIAKCVFGNVFATAFIASISVKPTPITSP